jgi:hypothetical protein
MSRIVLVLGESGTGKTSSIRNFKKGEAQVISCSGKELPFKSDLAIFVPNGYTDVYAAIEKANAQAVIIDDTNFLMVNEEFSRAKEVGYAKFTDFAIHLNAIFDKVRTKAGDQTFYIFAHPEERSDIKPNLEFKISAGKMSKKFPIGGLTNIVLESAIDQDGNFVFKTKTDGSGIKSPIGMFATPTVPNDLKEVHNIIVEYFK